ncbi:PAS domain-containing sensor histidine kinase [Bacillus badius]|uniref:histidine kinase n=1 Tax=Bacillus badius TaxID=1455 RepID=A0ABR5B083_BACBA|nr:PAS domain-containing sensor histidine kinase [Bacillus badius]KIL73345.1 Sporulation kinase B [Bacillus badius]KIL80353.1 Sporulation kinase B like protein [Bacillus badius]MED4716883.1 PAS domain S-box protein [Bacillus badius]
MDEMCTEQMAANETAKWFADKAKNILLLLDEQGNIQYANQAFKRLMPFSFENCPKPSLFHFIHKEDREEAVNRLLYFEDSASFTPFLSGFSNGKGREGQLLWQDAERTANGRIQVIAELIEEKGEEEQKEDGWLHFVAHHTEDPGYIVDLRGKVLLVNAAFEQVFGWKKQEVIGRTALLIPEENHREWQSRMDEVCDQRRQVTFQSVSKKKDGGAFPVAVTICPAYEQDGDVYLCAVFIKDLTECLETKNLLEKQNKLIAERERLLLDITENITEMISLFDVQLNKFLYISPSYVQFFNRKIEDLYHDPEFVLKNCHPEDLPKLVKFLSEPAAQAKEIEYRVLKDNGRELGWIHMKITPIADEEGTMNRWINISRDITELKKKELMIRKWDKLSAVGQLAAGIAHEVRNPLTSVKGFMQLLAQETNNKYTDIILSELERIEFIMNEFLILAKPHQAIQRTLSNINEVLQDVIEFMKPEALLYGAALHLDFDETLPAVCCEPKQIKQVIINLIKNAIDAMPSGGNIYLTTKLTDDNLAMIKVRDEGIGMSAERLERLGEPFYSNKEKGTGLGLMMCYKIIENHQGTIHFTSREGGGTTVRILLPCS